MLEEKPRTSDTSLGDILSDLGPGALHREVVVQPKTEKPHQAGVVPCGSEGPWVGKVRIAAERSLFVFAKGILGRPFLTTSLHRWMCDKLQTIPPRRKCLLLPKEHGKTCIVSDSLPLHILIQPRTHNVYFPGTAGSEQRILLTLETETRAKDHIRVLQTALESNKLLRAFWPHCVWNGSPKQLSKKWSSTELIIPRGVEWPDPSVRGIGVGQAIQGAHPNIFINDDLVTFEAANSPLVMDAAIEWFKASRTMMSDQTTALEFTIGTRWTPSDLYQHIIDKEPSVEVTVRKVIESGKPLWPEKYDLSAIEQIKQEQGVMFSLLYMNTPSDPSLTDFPPEGLRSFSVVGDSIRFTEDERDGLLAERATARPRRPSTDESLRGRLLTAETYDILKKRHEYLLGVRAG